MRARRAPRHLRGMVNWKALCALVVTLFRAHGAACSETADAIWGTSHEGWCLGALLPVVGVSVVTGSPRPRAANLGRTGQSVINGPTTSGSTFPGYAHMMQVGMRVSVGCVLLIGARTLACMTLCRCNPHIGVFIAAGWLCTVCCAG